MSSINTADLDDSMKGLSLGDAATGSDIQTRYDAIMERYDELVEIRQQINNGLINLQVLAKTRFSTIAAFEDIVSDFNAQCLRISLLQDGLDEEFAQVMVETDRLLEDAKACTAAAGAEKGQNNDQNGQNNSTEFDQLMVEADQLLEDARARMAAAESENGQNNGQNGQHNGQNGQKNGQNGQDSGQTEAQV